MNVSGNLRPDNPNAPRIDYLLYLEEKENIAGIFTAAILYGIIVVLFFQCMGSLLDPANRMKETVKWGLAIHTATMFSCVTVNTGMVLNLQSISYIDAREFPGINDMSPGPLGYQLGPLYSDPSCVIPNIMFFINTWLADGVLLYRCYIIYSMNYWVIAFPCLMYLASVVTGVMFVYYESSQPATGTWSSIAINFDYPHFSISLALNVLLSLMMVTRLVLHSRKIQNTVGVSAKAMYRTIITILAESSALYAVSYVLFIGPWGARSSVGYIFFPILAETQVIAPFLIILRIANRTALMSDTNDSEDSGPIHFRSQATLADSGQGIVCGGTICSANAIPSD